MDGKIHCPECGSEDVTCSENPHNHVCHACGYSMLPVMDAPDEMVEAVRDVVRVWLDGTDAGRFTNEVARAVLSVPSVAEVIARDAKVREIVARGVSRSYALEDLGDIAALYPEAGK